MVAETPRAMTLDRPPGAATQGAGAVTLHGAAEWAAHGAEAAPPAKAVALLPCARRAGMSNVGWLVAALRFGELALEARDHLAEVANLGLEAGDLRTAGAGRRASGAVAGARPALARAKRPWAEAAGPATEPAAVRPTCGFASGSVVTRAVIAGALGAGMILALPGIAHAVHGRTIRGRSYPVRRVRIPASRAQSPRGPAVGRRAERRRAARVCRLDRLCRHGHVCRHGRFGRGRRPRLERARQTAAGPKAPPSAGGSGSGDSWGVSSVIFRWRVPAMARRSAS